MKLDEFGEKTIADVTTYYDPADRVTKEEDKVKSDELVLLDKIEAAKDKFAEYDVKKSGKNNFHHYQYYELKDIMPPIREIKRELNLSTRFEFTDDVAILRVTDRETGAFEYYHCPLPRIYGDEVKKQMQDTGACQTYARRYLYLMFLEITEPDMFDSDGGRPPRESKKTPRNKKVKQEETTRKRDKKEEETGNEEQDSSERERLTPFERIGSARNLEGYKGYKLGEAYSHVLLEKEGKASTTALKKYALNQYQRQEITQSDYDDVIYVLGNLPVVE